MAIHVTKDGDPVLFSGKEAVNFYRLNLILRGMKFELKTGMKMTSRAPSCFTIARKEFGLKGNKSKLIEQFEKLVAEANTKMEYKHDA